LGEGYSYVWERVFAEGSATSITYGENSPAGAAALPYWSTLHCFADARFSFSTRLTLPEAFAQAAKFEQSKNATSGCAQPAPLEKTQNARMLDPSQRSLGGRS
jgi:hypothetical protein